MRVIIVDSNNNLLGTPDYTRFNKLPRYKKLYAFFNRKYKRKYVDFKGFEITGLTKEDFKKDNGIITGSIETEPGTYKVSFVEESEEYLKGLNND